MILHGLFVLSCLLLGVAEDLKQSYGETSTMSSEIEAARAAVLALYGSSGSPPIEGFRMPSRTEVLSFDEAATTLAAVPKPVQCRAEIQNEILMILCESVEPEMMGWWNHAVQALKRGESVAAIPTEILAQRECKFAVVAGDWQTVLTGDGVARWVSDYVIAGGFGISGRAPSKMEDDGVCWILTITGGSLMVIPLPY